MVHTQLLLKVATCLYGLSFGIAFLPLRRRSTVCLFLYPALVANAAAVLLRYQQAWPMLPMYLGPVALPLCLGGLILTIRQRDGQGALTGRVVLAQIFLLSLAAILFPKDYYLPFVKSQTVWAHLFFLFGVAGKGCCLTSAAWALASLSRQNQKAAPARNADAPTPDIAHRQTLCWAVWGFAFWTLSMFTGEMWSYLGWGTPVVWEDPAITTSMATWFFYICLLHLHLTGSWTVRSREIYAASGALVIFVLNCVPELGPFRWPL